jgi:cyclophilin family peptidyl-prolyl cis-trans isomerase
MPMIGSAVMSATMRRWRLRFLCLVVPSGACLMVAACGRSNSSSSHASDAAAGAPSSSNDLVMNEIARAEDRRRANDVSDEVRASHDVNVRRRAARALARIADANSIEGLLRALSDEDDETIAWGAYGLGYACKGREDATVRALAARGASLRVTKREPHALRRGEGELDGRRSIARAIGRCGGEIAERVLLDTLRDQNADARSDRERAAYALGDLSSRRGAISDVAATVLLDTADKEAAANDPSNDRVMNAALYAFSRTGHFSDAFAPRLLTAARVAISRATHDDTRIFAVRALRFAGDDATFDLANIAEGASFTAAERGEAARGLATMGALGKLAASRALARITPDKDPIAIAALGGDTFNILNSLIEAVASDPPQSADSALRALSNLTAPGAVPESLARRIAKLRCASASALAHGGYDADVVVQCDHDGSEPRENAELACLLRRPIVGPRRAKWRALASSNHVRVREAAIEAIGERKEIGADAINVLADALSSKQGGVVATAAKVLFDHPDRGSLADATELDAKIAAALSRALDERWPDSFVETRVNLVDAAVALRYSRAHDAAIAACKDANVTVRDRARKALRTLGDPSPSCPAPVDPIPAPEIGHELTHTARVTFITDAGEISMRIEPDLAPIAATRIVALARSGFYTNIVVHRVVPGFVVQFGDPGGDGFGGAPTLLRCETSPVPFAALDVGIPLAGRDTGASQLFVALSRVPHLDGEYTRVGRAEGDWDAIAEGDTIQSARVDE